MLKIAKIFGRIALGIFIVNIFIYFLMPVHSFEVLAKLVLHAWSLFFCVCFGILGGVLVLVCYFKKIIKIDELLLLLLLNLLPGVFFAVFFIML